jgi:hypothetical protein
MAVYAGESCPNDSAQIQKSFFVNLIATEQIWVVAKVTEEPIEFPKRAFGAVNPTGKRSRGNGSWLQNGKLQRQERLLRLPTIGGSLDSH